MMSMKLILAHVLQNFELSTSLKFDELEVDIPIILKIKQGYKLKITKRQKQSQK